MQKKDHYLLKIGQIAVCFLFCGLVTSVFAATPPPPPSPSPVTAYTMLENFSTNIPNLMRMLTAFAYVMGMYLIVKGLIGLRHAGEARSMMHREHGLMGPVIQIAVGAMLLYLPTTVQVGMSTFWADPNPYAYQDQNSQWAAVFNVVYMVIQFVGTLAFIRGLLMLSSEKHQGGAGKALVHIFGGILCINIYQFVQVMQSTFGLNQLNLN